VTSSLKAGSLVTVDLTLPKRQFFALRHKERYFTQAERALYKLIMEEQGAKATEQG
jgi:hypothetical protein